MEVRQHLVNANNAVGQALAEQQHVETQQKDEDLGEVKRQIEEAQLALKTAKKEVVHR